jgi:dTDP-4-amino-4,6-dideoxygalactose transaminase
LTTGPKTRRFEKDFADFVGSGVEAIAVNSATAGLHLALEACGIGPGDEIITSPYTFTATAEVARYLDADPVFVDIDPRTLNLDTSLLESAITARTRAIIPVHFGGLPCDMAGIMEIAGKYRLKIVEDAAHAFPSTYQGQLIGTLNSDATVFSFYATKTLATGEGGMIVTRRREIADRCRVMRLHGISHDAFDRYTATRPAWQYEVVAPGYKYNMTDLAASLGVHQLAKAYRFQRRRGAIAAYYSKSFADLPLILPPGGPGEETHSWHLFVVRLRDESRVLRDQFIREMAERGIGCSVHFIPLHLHPYWRDRYALKPEDFPCAEAAFRSAVSLPIYTKLTDEDVERVVSAVRSLLGHA